MVLGTLPCARLAVVCDFPEEGWHSMDLCGEMLIRELHGLGRGPETMPQRRGVRAERVCPPFRHCCGRLPVLGRSRTAFNADRLLNRFWTFPRHLRARQGEFDLYHVCDHSYAHLVHALPAGQTGVYCHDLDAFRCLLGPPSGHGQETVPQQTLLGNGLLTVPRRRPFWFKALARRIMRGLQKAARVFVSTRAVQRQLEAYQLVDPAKVVLAPYGISPEFSPRPTEEDDADFPTDLHGVPYLLHVGSCVARKRMDVLLDVFARVRQKHPDLRLVKVGGPWQPEQLDHIRRLGIAWAVTQRIGLDRSAVAALYRRAALTLLPSEAEGFGLPVLEALACGSPVVASDLPAVREVGGDAVVYCPVGEVPQWVETVDGILSGTLSSPSRETRLARAGRFSWRSHAATILAAYEELLAGAAPGCSMVSRPCHNSGVEA
jgi:glycosyltransferase involved in cell wall biosynthesis